MTKTQIKSHIWYLVCLIVALAANVPTNWVNVLGFLPVSPQTQKTIKVVITGVVGIAVWVKGHENLFMNPDGTAAPDPKSIRLVK